MKNSISEFNYSLSEKELHTLTRRFDARGFYEWLDDNNVDCVIHDVNLANPNEEWFNVSVPIDDTASFDVSYCDGVLESASLNEFSEI